MDNTLLIQLVASFFVGGAGIALLTFLAERARSQTAGIILGFPVMSAITLFFLGWILTPDEVARAVPVALIAMGLGVLFPVFYIAVANWVSARIHKKTNVIPTVVLVTILVWIVFAIPLAQWGVTSLAGGLLGYVGLSSLGYILLHRRKVTKPLPLRYTTEQKIGRAIFVGVLVVIAVSLGKTLGAFWGSVMSMFPAAFLSSLIMFHWYYASGDLLSFVQKVPIGTISIVMYTLTIYFAYPGMGIIVGTMLAFGISFITSFLIVTIQNNFSRTHE